MKMNYVRGGIMALLLKEVARSENRMGMGRWVKCGLFVSVEIASVTSAMTV